MLTVGLNRLISARVPARIEIHPGNSATPATTCAPQRVQKPRSIGWPLPPGELKRVKSPLRVTLSVPNRCAPACCRAAIAGEGGDSVAARRPPREVAEAILWLLSPESSYTTGSFIDVSGGK